MKTALLVSSLTALTTAAYAEPSAPIPRSAVEPPPEQIQPASPEEDPTFPVVVGLERVGQILFHLGERKATIESQTYTAFQHSNLLNERLNLDPQVPRALTETKQQIHNVLLRRQQELALQYKQAYSTMMEARNVLKTYEDSRLKMNDAQAKVQSLTQDKEEALRTLAKIEAALSSETNNLDQARSLQLASQSTLKRMQNTLENVAPAPPFTTLNLPNVTLTRPLDGGRLKETISNGTLQSEVLRNPTPTVTSTPNKYPAVWGTPPAIQTKDFVDLPLGGKGSSTLKNWETANIEKHGWPAGFTKPTPQPPPRATPTPATRNPQTPTKYPTAWGAPPQVQTKDIVALPLGGRGSSTLRGWQLRNIEKYGWPPGFEGRPPLTKTTPPPLSRSPVRAQDLLR